MHAKVSAFLSRWLLDRAGGHRHRVLAAYEARMGADRAEPEQVRRDADQALVRLLNHAREHVPHLKTVLTAQSPVDPANARQVLRSLPTMKRADVQAAPQDFLSDTGGPRGDDATGGSTGTPMSFKFDPETQVAREASLLWSDSLTGWRPGEKIAMLWGSDRDVKSAVRSSRLAVRWWIENRRWCNAFEMSEDHMRQCHRLLQQFEPDLLVAYASAAQAFARFLQRHGESPKYPRRAVVASAEVLTADMRREIEEFFRKPVFDRYGNREFGAMAAECEAHDGLHINETDCVLEVNSPDPLTVPGPIVVTYLRNFAMPFIRYDTEDLGLLAEDRPCRCGRTSRRLKQLVGRRSDMIRTADGRLVHGEYFTHLLYGEPDVRQFQFVQETANAYVLYLAADRARFTAREPALRSRILESLGRGASLRIEYVDRIAPTASGKHRFTLSRVAP